MLARTEASRNDMRATALSLTAALLLPATAVADLPAAAEPPQQGAQEPPPPRTERERRDRILERELTGALSGVEELPCGSGGLVGGVVFGAAATWVALETDIRGTWAVILGELAALSLGEAAIDVALRDPSPACATRFRALPSRTPAELARRVEVGRACLESEAASSRAAGYAKTALQLGVAGGVLALWGTDPPEQRDSTLLILSGATGLLAFTHLVPGAPESLWEHHLEVEDALEATPAAVVDAGGRLAPGLALRLTF